MVSFGYSTCSGKDTLKTSVQYKQVSAEQWTDAGVTFASNTAFTYGKGQISTETSYDVRYTLEDAFSTISVQEIVSTAAVVMDFKSGGKGVAIGKVSERDNTFEVAENWDVKVYGMLLKEYIQQIASLMYPVGSIYMSTKSTNPPPTLEVHGWLGAAAGCRWELTHRTATLIRWKTRRRLYGGIDYSADAKPLPCQRFTSYECRGAHAQYTEPESRIGTNSGNRVLIDATSGYTAVTNKTTTSGGAHTHTISGSTAAAGSGSAHNNLQPYIVCYMWKRTA